jgi:hypothetical protein
MSVAKPSAATETRARASLPLLPWREVVLPWLVSRVYSVFLIVAAASVGSGGIRTTGFAKWDGQWYLAIARFGYGPEPVEGLQTRWPFFPGFPAVVRAIREVGWNGLSIDTARTPLANMGQSLFEPPDVAGWDLGPSWFSSGSMLVRMNFAAQIAANQRFNLRDATRGNAASPDALVEFLLDRLTPQPFTGDARNALLDYARAGVASWTGSDTQRLTKASGLVHLIVGSANYQLV